MSDDDAPRPRRAFALVEGQTEEIFVRDVVAPHLESLGLYIKPVLVTTKRIPAGRNFRGGVVSWQQVSGDLGRLLRDSNVTAVTTVLDVYALPTDWPGLEGAPSEPYALVGKLEEAMRVEINDERFLPYLSLHEFEALVFVDPVLCEQRSSKGGVAAALQGALNECGAPELIDQGPQTAPSKRLIAAWPNYVKTVDGPALAAAIGSARLRQACPHLDAWLTALESL